jgi:hypothetical protein
MANPVFYKSYAAKKSNYNRFNPKNWFCSRQRVMIFDIVNAGRLNFTKIEDIINWLDDNCTGKWRANTQIGFGTPTIIKSRIDWDYGFKFRKLFNQPYYEVVSVEFGLKIRFWNKNDIMLYRLTLG